MEEPMALYDTIASKIRHRIISGQLNAGDSIGTQQQITQDYGISRVTLRHSLRILESEGLIRTIHGKGSFVLPSSISQQLGKLMSLSEVVEASGLNHRIEVTKFEWVSPYREIADFFALKPNNPVLLIERLHSINSQPAAIAVIYVPAHLGVNINRQELEISSLYSVMESRLGIRPGKAIQQIGAEAAGEHHAKLLKVPQGFPLLTAERKTLSITGEPIEHISFYYRSDTYKFTVQLSRAEELPMVVPSFPKGNIKKPDQQSTEWNASMQLKKVPKEK